MKQSEMLRKARDLIADQARWTKNVFARDEYGYPCSVDDGCARAYCAIGAIEHFARAEARTRDATEWLEAETRLQDAVGDNQSITEFNDSHTHEEVLALFDAAIALAEGDHQ